MAKKQLSKLAVVREFALPTSVKVAIFVGISAGFVYILDNVGSLGLSSEQITVLTLVVNVILAGLKKYIDEIKK